MNLVVDTSAIIAVVTNEPHKRRIVRSTKGADLLAPFSLHWEVGNVFSAMFKRRRLTLRQARKALRAYLQIPIRFCDTDLGLALELAERLDIYAYDAYMIACALERRCPLLTLDAGLASVAADADVEVVEILP